MHVCSVSERLRISPGLAVATCLILVVANSPSSSAALESQIRLPSDAAGGGTLGVYLQWPATAAEDRFLGGPPVVVYLQGTNTPGPDPIDLGAFADGAGVVVVQFTYPGWGGTVSSDGTYDYRGPTCILAARDVWLFALGLATDDLGRTIHDVVGRTVFTELMGVAASSGGNRTAPAVLSTYPADLAGRVRFVTFWETPGSDQIRSNELGRLNRDCTTGADGDGNGFTNDDGKNPRYDPLTDYGYTEVQLDYGTLRWDPTRTQNHPDDSGRFATAQRNGLLYWDGNGNGSYDFVPGLKRCADTDLNGTVDLDEDWWISHPKAEFFAEDDFRAYYSVPVSRYLDAHPEIFPGGIRPDYLGTEAEAEAFHQPRMASFHYHLLGAYARTLRTITAFDGVAHTHVTADHAQTRIEQDGLATSGLWRRLNPDASYVAEHQGSIPPGYPDSDANIDVPLGDLHLHAAPNDTTNLDLIIPATVELLDRTYYGGWRPQVDAVLSTPGAPAAEAQDLTFDDKTALSWNDATNNLFYDVVQGDVSALTSAGGSIDLGPLRCVEDDSTDLTVTDGDRPPPGTAWFYLVRPNSVGGHYGAGSSGEPRVPDVTDCLH